jgi:hypothetical protein
VSDWQTHSKVKIGSERNFGLVLAAAFTVIALLPLWYGENFRVWAIVVATIFLVPAIFFPHLLRPLNLLWFKFGLLLGKIVAPIVISAVFFVIVTPMALLMRLMGKDPLNRAWDPNSQTYWIKRDEQTNSMSSMKDQF